MHGARALAAAAALARGNTRAACSRLAAFEQQVRTRCGDAIAVATADAWLAQMGEIRSALGCRRLLPTGPA